MDRIAVVQGDITKLQVDAVVNAANSSLLGGSGVDGAIHRAAGPRLLEECIQIRNRQGGCATGQAVITSGGNLPARFVIHTVGPVWRGGAFRENELLRDAYRNSLKIASENQLTTVAFPNISTGIYGFPKGNAAAIAIQEVNRFLAYHASLVHVLFCCFDDENYAIYKKMLNEHDIH